MYQIVSERFEKKVNSSSRTFRAKFVFSSENTIESEIRSIKLTGQANSGTETLELGGTVSAQLEVETMKPAFGITGHEFRFYLGLILEDNSMEYIPMGVFTAQKPQETDDGLLTFTAYDRMVTKLDKPYFSGIAYYPVDAKDILREIEDMTGIRVSNLADLPSGIMVNMRTEYADDETISTTAPFTGYTYRETIGYIAQMFGTFATMDREGDLSFRWYSDTEYTVVTDRSFSDLVCAETVFQVQKLECSVGEDTLTSGNGTLGISMSNPVMTQEILDGVYKKVAGMSYVPATFSFLGNPCMDLGDMISVERYDGTPIKVPIMGIIQTYDGGLTTEVGSYGNTEESAGVQKGPTAKAIDRVYTDLFLVKEVLAGKVSAEYLEANYAAINELDVIQANVEDAVIGSLAATFATVDYLTANYATVLQLDAVSSRVGTLEADALTAASAVIRDLSAGVADINTLIFGSASGKVIQTEFSNAVIAQLGQAQIRSAMIESLSADKILSGSIYTNQVHIHGDGTNRLSIVDNTITVSDGIHTRVQIGKDASNDYNIYVWDASGNLMFDALGLTEDGVTRKVIRDDVVKEDANISASKLNIESLFTAINEDGSHVLNSGKISMDAEGQTLDVAFTRMTTELGVVAGTVSSQGTQISAIQGSITSKIWQQDITAAVDPLGEDLSILNTQYSIMDQTLGSLSSIVAGHTTSIDGLGTRVSSAESSITQQAKEIELKVSETDITGNYLVSRINLASTTAKIAAENIELSGYLTITSAKSTYATQSALQTTENSVAAAASAAGAAQIAADNAADAASTAQNTANTANARATYHYGTCATAAATVAKVVTLSGFVLYTGAVVSVRFTYANTAASPTLNVNATGAKPIYVYGAALAASSSYNWVAGATVQFTYNGTQWVMTDTSAMKAVANWCYNNNLSYINGANIYAGTVTANAIAAGTITADKIASGTITADRIASETITADKINLNDLFAQDITATGTITGLNLVTPHIYFTEPQIQEKSGLYMEGTNVKMAAPSGTEITISAMRGLTIDLISGFKGFVVNGETTINGMVTVAKGIEAADSIAICGAGEPDLFFERSDYNTKAKIYLAANSSPTLSFAVGTSAYTLVASIDTTGLRPYTNNAYQLGTTSYRWSQCHATAFYEAGTALASKYNPLISLTNNGAVVGTDGAALASGTTWVSRASFTLAAGTWLVCVVVFFSANATGRRAVGISKTSGGSPVNLFSSDRRAATNGDYTTCRIIMPIVTTASTTYYINAFQNSGSTLTTQCRLSTFKLK